MKIISYFIRLTLFLLLILLLSQTGWANSKYNMGTGASVQTNGFGFYIGTFTSPCLLYLSAGINSVIYTEDSGLEIMRGMGIGLINSSLISDSNNHGIGFHLSAFTTKDENETKLSLALIGSYTYYINGLQNEGWYFGGGLDSKGFGNSTLFKHLMISIGYQF